MSVTVFPGLKLRQWRATEYPQLFDLMQRIYPAAYAYLWPDDGAFYLDYAYNRATFESDLRRPNSVYYGVYVNGQLDGIMQNNYGKPLVDEPDRPASQLQRIYLGPASRGRGVGRKLIDWTAERARDFGSEILWLESMDSGPAIDAYGKLGFERCGQFRLTFETMPEELRGMYRLRREL